jgi:hypothetical protein
MSIADVITKQAVLNLVRPVGSQYIQYPANASNNYATAFPVAERPATLFGGTWVELWEDEAIFFRTGGTKTAELDRTSGKQADDFKSHNHVIPAQAGPKSGSGIYE